VKLDVKIMWKIAAARIFPRKALLSKPAGFGADDCQKAAAASAAEASVVKDVSSQIVAVAARGSAEPKVIGEGVSCPMKHESRPARLLLSPMSRKAFFTRNKTGHTDPVEECVQCGISRNFILKWYTAESGNPTGTLCRCCRKAKQLKYKRDRAAEKAAERRERATDVD